MGIAFKSGKSGDMKEIPEAEVSLDKGIPGDHRGRPGKRQVTVLAKQGWEDACREVDAVIPWLARRANLYVEGIDLEESTGGQIRIGHLILEITGETAPCNRMDQVKPGLQETLRPGWRGGVCCRVRQPGKIQPGDTAVLIFPAAKAR